MPEILIEPDGDPRFLIERWGATAEIPPEWKDLVPEMVKVFDAAVDMLRDPKSVQNSQINKLAANLWQLVGNKFTPTLISEKSPFGCKGLFFMAQAVPGRGTMASIIVPKNWLEQVQQDRWMQLGGMVFIASQCNDYWHDKIQMGTSDAVVDRGMAWESEFLNYCKRTVAEFKPNGYQSKVLEKFPKGLDSLDASLRYELKPYAKEDFDAIDRQLREQ